MKKLTYLLLFLVIAGCKKPLSDEPNQNKGVAASALLIAAKDYFNTQIKGLSIPSNNSSINSFSDVSLPQPLWRRYNESKTRVLELIEVPVVIRKSSLVLYNFQHKEQSELQRLKMVNSALRRLLIFRQFGGEFGQVLLTYLPDYEYLEQNKFDASDININQLKKYSGYIEYQSLKGEKLFVLRFKDGLLVKRYKFLSQEHDVIDIKSASSIIGRHVTNGWENQCFPRYCQNCNMQGDPPVEVCDEEYICGEWCQTVYIDDATNPYDDMCSNPETAYMCDPGLNIGGVGGGGGNNTPADTPKLDQLIKSGSSLSPSEKAQLEALLNEMTSKCMGALLYNTLVASNTKFTWSSSPNVPYQASFNPNNDNMIIKQTETLATINVMEELFHAYQKSIYPGGTAQYTGSSVGSANIEFESKVFRSTYEFINNGPFSNAVLGSDYTNWVIDITSNGVHYPTSFTAAQQTQYNTFLAQFPVDNPGYSYTVASSTLNPSALFSLFNSGCK